MQIGLKSLLHKQLTFVRISCIFNYNQLIVILRVSDHNWTCLTSSRIDVIPLNNRWRITFVVTRQMRRFSSYY